MYVFALTASQTFAPAKPAYNTSCMLDKVFGALLIAFTTRRMKTNVAFIDPHLLPVHCVFTAHCFIAMDGIYASNAGAIACPY